ncbi:hypothetical protein EsH8_IX_000003 [Colletotrichum jinshuiense]
MQISSLLTFTALTTLAVANLHHRGVCVTGKTSSPVGGTPWSVSYNWATNYEILPAATRCACDHYRNRNTGNKPSDQCPDCTFDGLQCHSAGKHIGGNESIRAMSIQILSDLHLEAPKAYDVFEITPKAPILALLGDVGNIAAHKDDCLAFLTHQLGQFRTVLFVPGNHEAYHSSWPETLGILRAFEKDVDNNSSLGQFVLLDRGVFRVPDSDVVVLGCSLFSNVPPESHDDVSFGLNDFFQINDWDIDAHNDAYKRDVAWLNAQVAELGQSDARIIIFTHWSPSRDSRALDPRHATSPITPGFATDLSGEPCFKSGKVKVWAFGHTHFNCDFTVERDGGSEPLRLLTNQRGYYFSQSMGFDEGKLLEG